MSYPTDTAAESAVPLADVLRLLRAVEGALDTPVAAPAADVRERVAAVQGVLSATWDGAGIRAAVPALGALTDQRPPKVEPTSEEALHTLLGAVHDALDVPWDACATSSAREDLIVRRSIAVRVSLENLQRYNRDPGRAAVWLRNHVDQHMPLPEGGDR